MSLGGRTGRTLNNDRVMTHRKHGAGLVEVLVAIGITGVILFGVVNVAAGAYRLLLRSEMLDISGGVLVRSLELVRTPANFSFNDIVGRTAGDFAFKLDVGVDEASLTPITASGAITEINSCDSTSQFILRGEDLGLTGALDNLVICNQIIVRSFPRDDTTGTRDFRVESVVVYEFDGEVFKEKLISNRREFVPG